MKALYISISIVLSALLFNGCVDMDTFPEGDIITSEKKEEAIAKDPNKAEAGITAIFAQFSTYMTVVDGRHNDIGYPGIMLRMDANGFDYVGQNNGYNWMGFDIDYSDRNYAGNESRIVWNTMYQMINAANSVISSLDPATEDAKIKFYLGQALATRAFEYWVLAQLYQFNYAEHKSSPCVPLITEANMVTASVEGTERSTVEEVYTQILTDLGTAIELLAAADKAGESRIDRRYIDVSVAYGLRARVNLTMENWAEAASDAKAAISASDAKPYTIAQVSVPAMNDISESAWMWGINIEESDRVVTSGICNWPSHMGSLNWGYTTYSGGWQISKALWNSIPESDVRKGWWLNADTVSPNLSASYQAVIDFYKYKPYTQVKFAPYNDVPDTETNASDIPLMRIEEMHLIQAEAEVMSGAGNGKATLEDFVKTYRDPEYVCTASSPADIRDEIYRQRRIEFWGEGMAWFDIMRLNKPVDRRGAGYPDAPMIFNIQPKDPILLWRIPEVEINANPLLDPEDNNPAAPFPNPVPDIE